MRIIPIIYTVEKHPLRSFNCYIVQTDAQTILIDAGLPSDDYFEFFKQTLQNNHLSIEAIDAIYLTHHHEDHVGMLQKILTIKQMPIYIHEEALVRLRFEPSFLKMRINFFERLYKKLDCFEDAQKRLVTLKQTLKNSESSKIEADFRIVKHGDSLGEFTVYHLPGHTEDSIGFYNPNENILFAGDVLLKRSSTNAIIDPLSDGSFVYSSVRHRETLQQLYALNLKKIYPGHEEPFEDVGAVLQQKFKKFEHKEQKLLNLLTHPMTGKEIAKNYYHHFYEKQFSLVMSEILGLLLILEQKQRVTHIEKDGRSYFSKIEG